MDLYVIFLKGEALLRQFQVPLLKKHRCFPKDWSPRFLGITWANNKTAWMNTLTFTEFITEFDDTMMRRHGGEEVLLLMDNAPSHKLEDGVVLQCTRIAFLPPNTTTHLQPMDAGIIANFKHHYKKLATRAQLNMIINGEKVRINQYQALLMCKKAWDAVSAQTIERCWYKTGLIPRPVDEVINAVTADDEVQLTNIIQDTLDEMQIALPEEQIISAEQYTSLDNDVATESELSIEEAIQVVLCHDPEEVGGSGDEPTSATTVPVSPEPATHVPTVISILDKFHDLQDACMCRNDMVQIAENLGTMILQLEQKQQHARVTQTSIINYFRQ